jgi:hypothetical protein
VWPAAARWFLTWPGRRVTDVPSYFPASSELATAVVGEVAPARSSSPATPLLRPQGCAGDACPRPAVRSQSRDFPSRSLSDGNTYGDAYLELVDGSAAAGVVPWSASSAAARRERLGRGKENLTGKSLRGGIIL